MTPATYDECFALMIDKNEGGFQKNPNDPGNWTGGYVGVGILKGTKYGISAKSFPDEDIEGLTYDRAKWLAKPIYWDRLNADSLPVVIRFDVFDMCYQSGAGNAARTLQKAVGATEDGAIGPLTLARIVAMHPWEVKCKFNGYRLAFLASLSIWQTLNHGLANRIAGNLVR